MRDVVAVCGSVFGFEPVEFGKRHIEVSKRPKSFRACPRFSRGSANGIDDEADGDSCLLLNLAGEIVANRRDPACALGGDDAPVAFNEVDVAISGMTLDVEEANLGMVCRLNFLVGILCEFKRQPHVRLATA
jgi:hypothetical protein